MPNPRIWSFAFGLKEIQIVESSVLFWNFLLFACDSTLLDMSVCVCGFQGQIKWSSRNLIESSSKEATAATNSLCFHLINIVPYDPPFCWTMYDKIDSFLILIKVKPGFIFQENFRYGWYFLLSSSLHAKWAQLETTSPELVSIRNSSNPRFERAHGTVNFNKPLFIWEDWPCLNIYQR